jgi:hypothetical protein
MADHAIGSESLFAFFDVLSRGFDWIDIFLAPNRDVALRPIGELGLGRGRRCRAAAGKNHEREQKDDWQVLHKWVQP